MSYDANSPQARKGALGEQIVKKLLERQGYDVEKPDGVSETTPTRIDWVAYNDTGEFFCVEVKTQKKFPYSFDAIPTFKIPLSKYEGYKDEAEERGGILKLCFVSSEDGKIYCALGTTLDAPYRFGGFEFPVQVALKDGDPEICFCVDQFVQAWDIDEDDLAALRAIDAEICSAAQAVKSDEVQVFTAPNGAIIPVLELDGEFYVQGRILKQAIGFDGVGWQDGSLEQAARQSGARITAVSSVGGKDSVHLDVRDIPDVLKKFIEATATPVMNTKKFRRNEAAKELLTWFNETVIPKLYGTAPAEENELEPVEVSETLGTLVVKLAAKVGLDANSILDELRKLKIRQDPVLSELFEL